MRIISTPKRKDNGFPFIGTVTLLKDSEIRQPKDGLYIWQGFGRVERVPKGEFDSSVTYSISAMKPLSTMLVAWPKGTVLFIAGSMVKDDYWTKREGHEVYKLIAEFVMTQKDYAAELRMAASSGGDDDDGVSSIEYDPGF